jgi:hypothetical protein
LGVNAVLTKLDIAEHLAALMEDVLNGPGRPPT